MLNISNMGPKQLRQFLKEKKIILFGAGRAMESCIDIYFGEKEIEFVVDNNKKMWGKSFIHHNKEVQIVGINYFLKELEGKNVADYVLMITSTFYAADIVEQLDKIDELNGMYCFFQIVVRNTVEKIPEYSFSHGEEHIPKKIHYFWIGENPLPEEYIRNIATWKYYNPDFEIIQWDESNYDFSKCVYTKECIETKSWGFAINHARIDVINNEGGIYLDTDVIVKSSLIPLLNDEAFFNMGCADRINMGCGFGAKPHMPILRHMMEEFEETHFVDVNGVPQKRPCHLYIHPVLRNYGFSIENRYQKINNIVLYPCEVMSPMTIEGMPDYLSKRTISVHMEKRTWTTEKEKAGIERTINLINERMLK